MPGINLRFTKDLKCAACGEVLGSAGSYATLKSEDGAIILFNDAQPPGQLAVRLECSKGHRTEPKGCSLEFWFMTPRGTAQAPGSAIARL